MTRPDRPAAELELLGQLANTIDETLSAVIPAGSRVALLDVPDHTNVGDHAITVGEFVALRRAGFRLTHASALETGTPRRLAERLPETVILLHGGGNLGDLWPAHQRYREEVLARFPQHKVVQLPQSLAFERSETLTAAQRAFDGHPDFTLMVRDRENLNFARREFSCRVELCPDSALALGPLATPSTPSRDVLCLARHDHERLSDEDCGSEAVDWPRPLDRRESFLAGLAGDLGAKLDRRPRRPSGGERLLALALERLARRRLHRGICLLAGGRTVVTNRLHAHLLSLLLGIPNVVANTRSGKVHDFVDTWTESSALVRRADSLADGLRMARDA